jgi:UrcA family protein
MRTLGIFMLAASVTAATPALAGEARLTWSDLDLTTDAGKTELDRRIAAAATEACRPQVLTGSTLSRRAPAPRCLADTKEALAARIAAQRNHGELAAGPTTSGESAR